MSRFLSAKNVVIMICRSGRRRSVANAEWSNTLTRYGRLLHSIHLLHLSDLDFWEKTCAGNSSECSKQFIRVFQAHYDRVQAECLRRVPVLDPVTGRWKRSRSEHGPAKDSLGGGDHFLQTSKKRATSATTTPAGTTSRGILDGLAERLGNFHDSARALASCLQNRDVSGNTDQSMIEAAKCMFHKLLGKASDDLERATPRSRESLCTETTQNRRRCSRPETPTEKPCSRSETLSEKPCSRPETLTGKLRCRFEMPSEKSVWQTSTDGKSKQHTGTGCRRRSSQASTSV